MFIVKEGITGKFVGAVNLVGFVETAETREHVIYRSFCNYT